MTAADRIRRIAQRINPDRISIGKALGLDAYQDTFVWLVPERIERLVARLKDRHAQDLCGHGLDDAGDDGRRRFLHAHATAPDIQTLLSERFGGTPTELFGRPGQWWEQADIERAQKQWNAMRASMRGKQ